MEKEDKGLKMANGNEEMVGDQGGSPGSDRCDVYDRMREDADVFLLSDYETAYSLAAAGLGGEPKDGADGAPPARKSPNAVWSLVEKQPPSGRNRARRVPPRAANSSKNNGVLGVAGTPNFVAPHRNWKNSRRSRNLHGRGLPKKGGAGGKGVWGKPGAEVFDELDDEDPNDPNFDIDAYNSSHNVELKEVVPAPPPVVELTEEEIIKKMESILLEYYENGDTDEAADGLERILSTERKPLVIKTIVGVAFDHKQSQREMTSVLISDLYGRVVTRDDICAGFDQLLYELPDIMLDTPDAPHLLGNFIARAIADDCVPPKYAYESEREDLDNHARSALVRASALLSMPGGWSKLDNVWGVGGALRPVQTITHQMALLLQEYVVSREIEEAQRSIKELEVPHFHHELIYEAIILTLEAFNESIEEAICHLFRTLDSTCIVSPEQMEIGFRRVYDDMTDIVLDIPLAYSILDRFIQRCRRAGSFLSESLIKDLPTRGRKRFVSEGDGGLVKQVNFLNNM